MTDDYLLSQGEADVDRLVLLNQVYGPSSEALLAQAGLKPGMRVAEIGCGTGNMTCRLAALVSPGGHITAVDFSSDSLEQARNLARSRQIENVDFVHGDVNQLSLPPGTFDLAYCRLVLMHQKQPVKGLKQMRNLVRPGGLVVSEELDLSRCLFNPHTPLLDRMMDLNVALGDRQGVQFRLGSHMNSLFREAGFETFEASFVLPAVLSGPTKYLLTLSFREMAHKVLDYGLATQSEIDDILRAASRTDADTTTLYGMPLMGQAWGRVA